MQLKLYSEHKIKCVSQFPSPYPQSIKHVDGYKLGYCNGISIVFEARESEKANLDISADKRNVISASRLDEFFQQASECREEASKPLFVIPDLPIGEKVYIMIYGDDCVLAVQEPIYRYFADRYGDITFMAGNKRGFAKPIKHNHLTVGLFVEVNMNPDYVDTIIEEKYRMMKNKQGVMF
jgi:hypothetical protein